MLINVNKFNTNIVFRKVAYQIDNKILRLCDESSTVWIGDKMVTMKNSNLYVYDMELSDICGADWYNIKREKK